LACLIVAPQRGYDEPAILSYAISSFCPTSADGLHSPSRIKKLISRLYSSIALVRYAWHRIRLGAGEIGGRGNRARWKKVGPRRPIFCGSRLTIGLQPNARER